MREGLLGWATEALVQLDDKTPGVLARVLTAAPVRRQAIFAALAVPNICDEYFRHSTRPPSPELSDVLRHGRVSDILRHAYGSVPEGFVGVLERIGERPLERPETYVAIRDVLAAKDQRAADALRSAGRITLGKIRALGVLDPRWAHAHLLSRVDTTLQAHTFNSAVAFVQSVNSKATDDAVAEAIARMTATSTLPRLLQRLLLRADRLPPHPILHQDDDLRPLLTVNQHLEVARRYRNCLASKIGEVAAGRMAVAEYKGKVLLEFRPMTADAGWLLWTVHGSRNGLVDNQDAEAAAAKCEALGIPGMAGRTGGAPWRSYRRIMGEMDLDWVA